MWKRSDEQFLPGDKCLREMASAFKGRLRITFVLFKLKQRLDSSNYPGIERTVTEL